MAPIFTFHCEILRLGNGGLNYGYCIESFFSITTGVGGSIQHSVDGVLQFLQWHGTLIVFFWKNFWKQNGSCCCFRSFVLEKSVFHQLSNWLYLVLVQLSAIYSLRSSWEIFSISIAKNRDVYENLKCFFFHFRCSTMLFLMASQTSSIKRWLTYFWPKITEL